MNKPFPAYEGDDSYFFVSYAHADADQVYAEMSWLKAEGYNLWYDDGIHVGSLWRRALATALSNSAGVIFYCTERAGQSENCSQEINFALEEGKPVYVVHLDDTPLPAELRLTLNVRQNLKRNAFEEAQYRARLIQALGTIQAESEPTSVPATPEVASAEPGHLGWPGIGLTPIRYRESDDELSEVATDIAEDLASQFSGMQWRVAKLATSEPGAAEIEASAAAVRLILTTRLRRRGDSLQVTSRVRCVSSGEQVYLNSEEVKADGLDTTELANMVASKVYWALTDFDRKRIIGLPLQSLDAWACLCSSVNQREIPGREALKARLDAVKRSIELAPDKAHCYGSAILALIGYANFIPVSDTEAQAWGVLDFADNAISLAPHDAYTLNCACFAYARFGDPNVAVEFGERSRRLHHRIGTPHIQALIILGRASEVIQFAEENQSGLENFGTAYMVLDRPEEAAEQYRQAIAGSSQGWITWMSLAAALASAGKVAEGSKALDRGLALSNERFSLTRWEQGWRSFFRGNNEQASKMCKGLELLAELREKSQGE